MSEYVFDSSAVLAMLLDERGADYASDRIKGAYISGVNFAEVVSKLVDLATTEDDIHAVLQTISLKVVDLNEV